MPSIVIVADDGTKFELPEESAGFSGLLKSFMEQWTRQHDAATTPSSLLPQGDAMHPTDDDDDDSTAEDVGRNWPLGGDDASTCSQLSDFPEEDRYYQGTTRIGLKQSVERSSTDGLGAVNGLDTDALFNRRTTTARGQDDDEVLAGDGDDRTLTNATPGGATGDLTAAAVAASSDTDSDRTASIAPDMDSRCHSNASSQGSVGFISGMGAVTPPRGLQPGVCVSPKAPQGTASLARRPSDAVNVETDSTHSSDDGDADSNSGVDGVKKYAETPHTEKGAGEGTPVVAEGESNVTLLGPRDDSVTPSSLSDDEPENFANETAKVRDEAEEPSAELGGLGSGRSSGASNRRVLAEQPPDGANIPVNSAATTPDILSPTHRAGSPEEQEVVETLTIGSPPSLSFAPEDGKGEADAALPKAISDATGAPPTSATMGSGSLTDARTAQPGGDRAGTDAPRRGAARQGCEVAGDNLSPAPGRGSMSSTGSANAEGPLDDDRRRSSSLLSSSSSTDSQSRKGSGGSGVGGTAAAGSKSPSLSLRERLEDASLRHKSDDDRSEDADAMVEPIRLPGTSSHVQHRDPRKGVSSQLSSEDRRTSSGSRGSGSNDHVTAVRKAYTIVVSAAELFADEDDDDNDEGNANGDDGAVLDPDGPLPLPDASHRDDVIDPAVAAQSLIDAGAPSTITTNLAANALAGTSPHNFHQRTPVMIGADEECVHLLSSEGHATIPTPKESLDGVVTHDTSSSLSGVLSNGPEPSSPIASSTHTAAGRAAAANVSTSAASSDDDDDDDYDSDDVIHYEGAIISKHKILVDLVHPNSNSTPSQGATPRAGTEAITTAATITDVPPLSSTSTGTAAPLTAGVMAPPRALPVDSVRLCVEYLNHFAALVKDFEAEYGEIASGGLCHSSSYISHESRTSSSAPQTLRTKKEKETRPAELPMPLARPLVALLTDWEVEFLYTTVLQVPAATTERAKQATRVCPELDYRYPGMYLQREPLATTLRDALRVPAPDKAGLVRLRELMQTAKQLRIESLVQLLTAWLADYMLRMCYCGADNFEAAHLIRFCFQVQNDFNRREMGYLKIENEWPANEEE